MEEKASRRIGVLCNHIGGPLRSYENEAMRAIDEVAEERSLSVVLFPGRFYRSQSGSKDRCLFHNNLAAEAGLDGVIIFSSILSGYLEGCDFDEFIRRLGSLPRVSLGMVLPGVPSVLLDNETAMKEAVAHLVRVHGARRVGFIRGPEGNAEARARFAGYKAALEGAGIPYDDSLVAPGDFLKASGALAVRKLLAWEQRRFDALVACNDEMALGAMEELAAAGIRCPRDYLLAGFDDLEASRLAFPPITTVRQEVYLMGRKAAESLVLAMEGGRSEERSFVRASFIPRGSCGCAPAMGAEMPTLSPRGSVAAALPVLVHKLPPMGGRRTAFAEARARALLEGLDGLIRGGEPGGFNALFLETLELSEREGMDPGVWKEAVDDALAAYAAEGGGKTGGPDPRDLRVALHRAACDFAANSQRRALQAKERVDFAIAEVGEGLVGAKRMEELAGRIAQGYDRLGALSCLVASAEGGELRPAALYLKGSGARVLSGEAAAASLLLAMVGAPRYVVVESLVSLGELVGMAFIGFAEPAGATSAAMRTQLSYALRNVAERVEAARKREEIEELNRGLERQLRRLSSLRMIDMAITARDDGDSLLGTLLEQTTEQLGADAASILLATADGAQLVFGAGRGFWTETLRHTRLAMGEGFAGEAARENRIVIVEDIGARPAGFARAPLFRDERFVAYCAAPLAARGELKGVLEVFNRTPLAIDGEWTGFLEALAGQAAIALDNRSLMSGLRKANDDLLLAYDETIEGWSRALDLRDHETEGHSLRVAEASVRLARELGLGADELALLHRGALLHDIGKVGIPDAILLKQGALDAEELALMRMHPQYAYDLLHPIEYLRPVIDIPWCHHEWWNGAGYPRGLAGEDIPLSARIFALIDVWDALISDRVYRKAWERGRAIEYIERLAGVQFDPAINKAFLDIFG